MRRFRTFLTLLLAIFWLPVTSHCLLFESGSGFEFLSCCTHPEPPAAADHHEGECATDSCSIVESAQYKSSLQRLTVPPLNTSVAFELPSLHDTQPAFIIRAEQLTDLPPELPGWQFAARTALPPRAPSFVS